MSEDFQLWGSGRRTIPPRPEFPEIYPENDERHWYDLEFAGWNVRKESLPNSPGDGSAGKRSGLHPSPGRPSLYGRVRPLHARRGRAVRHHARDPALLLGSGRRVGSRRQCHPGQAGSHRTEPRGARGRHGTFPSRVSRRHPPHRKQPRTGNRRLQVCPRLDRPGRLGSISTSVAQVRRTCGRRRGLLHRQSHSRLLGLFRAALGHGHGAGEDRPAHGTPRYGRHEPRHGTDLPRDARLDRSFRAAAAGYHLRRRFAGPAGRQPGGSENGVGKTSCASPAAPRRRACGA